MIIYDVIQQYNLFFINYYLNVLHEDKEIFAINYNKVRAEYTNKSFYQFRPTRELTKALRINV